MASHAWESPRAGCGVVWGERLMSELRALAIEAFAASPRHGLEVGGILLGDVRGRNLRIGGFEEVPIEHRYGPPYSLSEKDWAALDTLLAARRGREPGVIGFFRSFVGRDPVVDGRDAEFVTRRFSQGDFLFMALQPLSAATCVAGFRFFQNGALLPRSGDPPFVLEPVPAGREDEEKILWPPLRHAQPPLERSTEPRSLEPAPAPLREEKRARWWIALLVAVVLTVNAAAVLALWNRARAPHWTELHLDAVAHAGSLEITWDTGAALKLGATVGLLTVTDAGDRHEMALTEDQVRGGSYEYTPATGDDDGVRLILYTKGKGVAGDSVRLASTLVMPGPATAGETERSGMPAVLPPQPRNGAPPISETAETVQPSPEQTPQSMPRAETPSLARTAPAISVQPAPRRLAAPPWPVHETEAQIPEGIRSRLRSPLTIAVALDVSAQGRVVHARSEASGDDDVQRYLSQLAERTALGWRFRPARGRDGNHVAASTTIRFVFYPWNRSASARTGGS